MKPLEQIVEKLQDAFGSALVSVILYGSAASEDGTDRFSDFNIFCVLKQLTPNELEQSEPVLHWWQEQGNPSPLLMSEAEVSRSADSFPIEFRDMQQRRRVLYGVDVIAEMTVPDTHYRAHVEHELRVNLLRLRQRGAGMLSAPENLLRLCADSVTTFCALARHALTLAGIDPAPKRRGVLAQLHDQCHLDVEVLALMLDIREETSPELPDRFATPRLIFAEYLLAVGRLIDFVDRLHDGREQS